MSETIKGRIEAAILRVAKERGVVMGTVAADHMAIDVLQAIREPIDQMGNGLPEDYRPGSHSATQIWRAMIDAALSEVGAFDRRTPMPADFEPRDENYLTGRLEL